MEMSASLAQRLPDIPRWVEARALLLWERCQLFGLEQEEPAFVLRDPETDLVAVVGHPSPAAIGEGVARLGEHGVVIAPVTQRSRLRCVPALQGWNPKRVLLHVLKKSAELPSLPRGSVRMLPAGELGQLGQLDLDPVLRGELELGMQHSPLAVALADGRPAAFCYAGAITETLWDISIDTLPQYRLQGHASRAVTVMIERMWAEGRQPVWGAVVDNEPSWRLARKLGFVPVDVLVLFQRR